MSLYDSLDRIKVSVTLNGEVRSAACETRTTLADFLRHGLGATGTHVGCEHGVCGACTVDLDGQPVRSCLTFAFQADGRRVDTVEGMGRRDADGHIALDLLQQAFRRHHGLQCGFCTPGMLISARDLLRRHPDPSEAEVREHLSGNLCRCTGYAGIVTAVLDAARRLRDGGDANDPSSGDQHA